MSRITPFLWFDHQALEAARYYVGIFPNSKIHGNEEYPPDAPFPEGEVMTVSFELDGMPFVALNGGPMYTFNQAVSFVIDCADQSEVDYYWNALTADGGTEIQCGWLTDRFGVPWQVVPKQLGELTSTGTPEQSNAVFQAMMTMVKLDVAGLQAAFDGA